jgi:hypothetical protein
MYESGGELRNGVRLLLKYWVPLIFAGLAWESLGRKEPLGFLLYGVIAVVWAAIALPGIFGRLWRFIKRAMS